MRARAKILIAGTLIATTTFAGAATSQVLPSGVVVSDQTQAGDVLANGTLDVVDVSGPVDATTTATGNALAGEVDGAPLTLTATQTMQGAAKASTVVTAAGAAGSSLNVTTEAVGNTGDAAAYGGDLSAQVTQATAGDVTADSSFTGAASAVQDSAAVSATALANSQAFAVSGGTADATVAQSAGGLVQAQADLTLQHVEGPAVVSTAAVANNLSVSGADATQTIAVSQSMTGARTQASTFVAGGNLWQVAGSATATANNVAITSQGPALNATVTQTDGDYVRAEAQVASYQFGLGAANAYGVANSALVGGEGELTVVGIDQTASGGVESIANFSGHDGYDAYATATAMGNAATGYACSACSGTISANNRQINDGDVAASAGVSVAGSNRGAAVTTTAVGNTASFYVTKPAS